MKHDLGIGEPRFLTHVENFLSDYRYDKTTIKNRGYPAHTGEPELVEALSHFPGKYKVICNGAKQALHAALDSVRTNETDCVLTRAPYWNYLPRICRRLSPGLFVIAPGESRWSAVTLNTTPNNPDGSISEKECDVWDAAYAHSVYGFDSDKTNIKHKVSVWSASKLFGLSYARIGWLATDSAEIADSATKYVEETTSGVSRLSQQLLLGVLKQYQCQRHEWEIDTLYRDARGILEKNAKTLFDVMSNHIRIGNILENGQLKTFSMPNGMFAWVKADDAERFQRALNRAEIKTIPGIKFGMTEGGWHRISLGCRQDQMEEAMEDFTKAY